MVHYLKDGGSSPVTTSTTPKRTLSRVSVHEFRLGGLLNGDAEAVYFRTNSENVYRLDKSGKLEGARDEERGWDPVYVDMEHGNPIVIGESFHTTGRHTMPVTEIVCLMATGVTRPAELLRPSELTIVEDFERKRSTLLPTPDPLRFF